MSLLLHRMGIIAAPRETGLASLTRVGQVASTGSTVSIPAGVQAGDLLLYGFAAWTGSSNPSYTPPSGWTSLINATMGENGRIGIAAKRATGSESGSIGGVFGNAGVDRKVCVLLRPNVPLASVGSAQSVASQFTTDTPSDQVVTSGAGTPPLLVLALWNAVVGTVSTRGMSPAKDDEYNSSTNLYLGWKLYPSSPANVTVSMEDEGSNAMGSCYTQLSIA